MIGQTVSHYKITAKLGAGGMGQVYLASDTKLDRQVALKFLPSAVWNESEAQQRLIREAKAASKLDHPNIVTIYGIEEFEGRPFIIMANVPGAALNEYCTSAARSIEELIEVAIQIADGLQHAHEAGVIHRDLKPSNILVDDRGRARVLDFGIASLRGAAKLTQAGSTVGTLAYAPPELAMGMEATATSDIYSLGVVMYQMLTGRLPFDADHEAALLYSILNEPPRPLSDFVVSVPADVQKIIMRCLEKQPEKRFASCRELAEELKKCRRGAPVPGLVCESVNKPSIAVLPFANMSADPENEYFSDGLSEELMNVLAKNPQLKVTGRTSSFAFKGKHEDLREIGHKLGVETLLEGSVRKAGNRVRITTQLVKASDGFHLWSETYDRVLDDIFAVQDDIAQAVASAMNVALLGENESKPCCNAECYSLILQANHFNTRNTKEAVEKAIALYQEVLAIDPEDARAWAGISRAYATQGGYGHADNEEAYRKAKYAAEKAVTLDDTLPEAHDTVGWIAMSYEGDWDKAGREFRRGFELAPGNSRSLMGLASYEAVRGQFDDANRHAKESVEIDPLSAVAHAWRARIQLISRLYDEARESYTKALVLSPGMTAAQAMMGIICMLQGHYEEALAICQKEGSTGYRSCGLALIYHALGDKQKSDEQLGILLREGEQWGVQIAIVHGWRGENDQAFEWLERARRLHDPGLHTIKYSPAFDSLHDDSRWGEFLDRIGLGE